MKSVIAILALCCALAGCATSLATAPPSCLPLSTYSPAQQKALAEAVAALPPGSPLLDLVTDYAAMRDADRACRGAAR